MFDQGQSGANGIKVVAARSVYVIDCLIKNFSINGISFDPANTSALFVQDSIVVNNGNAESQAGILVRSATGLAIASIDHTTIDGNSNGVLAQGNSKVAISNSTISGNLRVGARVVSDANGPAEVNIESSVIANNRVGIEAGGCGGGTGRATARISNVSVTGNIAGGLRHASATVGTCGPGDIVSSQNNTILGNTPNGEPTQSFPQR